MKKSAQSLKLKLDRETIRLLSDCEIRNVQGGRRTAPYSTDCGDGMTATCQ